MASNKTKWNILVSNSRDFGIFLWLKEDQLIKSSVHWICVNYIFKKFHVEVLIELELATVTLITDLNCDAHGNELNLQKKRSQFVFWKKKRKEMVLCSSNTNNTQCDY